MPSAARAGAGRCAYCAMIARQWKIASGRPGADTRDHVIPESFFPTPKPNNLITLPAHYSCHNRLVSEKF